MVSGALPGLRGRGGGALRRDLLPELGDGGVPNAPEVLPTPLRLTFMGRLEPRYTTKMATACHQW